MKIVPGFSRAVHVFIKVSLQNLMVYAKEGDKPVLVAATAIGTLTNPTPPGRFRVTLKIENKRSNSYGSWSRKIRSFPTRAHGPELPGYYSTGYPMPYWVEWIPAYGSMSSRSGRSHEPTMACIKCCP